MTSGPADTLGVPVTDPDATVSYHGPIRCHWVRVIDPPDDIDPWILVPGCNGMAADVAAECNCDTLATRRERLAEQRVDCDRVISTQRERLRKWREAGAAAWSVLTGRPATPGVVHPEDLTRAVRDRVGAR